MKTIAETFNEELRSFREEVVDFAKTAFEEEKKMDPTVMLLTYKDGKLKMGIALGLGQLFTSDQGKEMAAQVIKDMNKEVKCVAIAFISEGWYVTKSIDKMNEYIDENGDFRKQSSKPSLQPDRKEMLFINFETFDRESNMCWQILRDADNNPRLEETLNTPWQTKAKELASKGRFTNLLQENYSVIAQEVAQNLKNSQN